jgi:hypothetical protein
MEPVVGIPLEVQKITEHINNSLKQLKDELPYFIPEIVFSYGDKGQLILKYYDSIGRK